MRVVALVSGGKDSCFNMMQCIAAGHEIVALANLVPKLKTEIDSYMYQSVGYEAIEYIAQAMDLPLYRKSTLGLSSQQGLTYKPVDEADEVEDLFILLKDIQKEIQFDAVSVGAILSDYQRIRVESVCIRLNLIPLAYLWQRDQKELINEMIKCEIDAIIIKVATLGLDPQKHLGRSLSSLLPHLHSIHDKYGLNVCGEGGEYETLTLDCPLFRSRIIIEESAVVMHTNDPIAPVGYLILKKLSLETKLPALDLNGRLNGLPLKDSDGYVTDDGVDACDELDEDINEIDNNQMNVIESIKDINQNPKVVKSSDGWLWIGGIQGDTITDYRIAMQECTTKLKSLLEEHEQTVKDVCSITMFISDMSHYHEINQIYCETFNHLNPPTRACVQIPSKNPVILSAVSWSQRSNNSGELTTERHTMHVQSRSHWAPANIGPYSQAVRIGDFIYLAGQIGLVPGSLELVKGGIKPQCQLALRHIGRLLKAVDSNIHLRDVVQGICYTTHISFVEHARKLWEEKTNNAIVDYVVVTNLPKNALIEWHVWAHRFNNQFEYEETGKCLEIFSISIYRRCNYENNIATIVCHVESTGEDHEFTDDIFIEAIDYALDKLKHGHENGSNSVYSLTIFCPQAKICYKDFYGEHLEMLASKMSLVYTFVPVLYVKNEHTYLSICGVRNQ